MIYLDMDGVLCKYDYDMYSKERKPAWNEVGSHVFLMCQKDIYMAELVERLTQSMSDEIKILTSVYNADIDVRNEQIFDKMQWLTENYPNISLCNFIASGSDKRNTISQIKGMKLTKQDILIDDYKKNLISWASAGGTAIKYINGLNSIGEWPGVYIDSTCDSVNTALSKIMECWYKAL
jgi:5'(3')-deoxyribonucleotidase